MTGKIFEPTMALRWVEVYDAEQKSPLATTPGWPECGDHLYKLQQAWICKSTGEIQWRDIEIEHNP